MSTILYLGMADDIITPMMIVPDFRYLYVIDKFDKCYSAPDGTLESQRDEIRNILLTGSDETSISRREWLKDIERFGTDDDMEKLCTPIYLKGKSIILREIRLPEYWLLEFEYDGKERTLCIYSRDFLLEWPDTIQRVDHVMAMGASSILTMIEKPGKIFKMLDERTNTLWSFYQNNYSWNGSYQFPYIFPNCRDEIAMINTSNTPVEDISIYHQYDSSDDSNNSDYTNEDAFAAIANISIDNYEDIAATIVRYPKLHFIPK